MGVLYMLFEKGSKHESISTKAFKIARFWHPYVSTHVSTISDLLSLIFSKYGTPETVRLSSTGAYQFFYNDFLILYAGGDFSEHALDKNFISYQILSNGIQKYLVDYSLRVEHIGKHKCYIIDRLKAATVQDLDFYLKCIIPNLGLKEIKTSQSELLSIFNIGRSRIWTRIIIILLGINQHKHRENYLLGFMHGDLHGENLMINKKNKLVLIDLDRALVLGPVFIDYIHAEISKLVAVNGGIWCRACFNEKIRLHWKSYEINIYFVYRLLNEFSLISRPSLLYRLRVLRYAIKLRWSKV